MELHYEKIDKDLYVLDDFFTIDEFIPLSEELHGMYHTFQRKREDYAGKSKPYWLALRKCCPRGSALGDNFVFLERSLKIRWAISKILRPDFSFELKRINTNLQWMFQDSSFHLDSFVENDRKYWSWTFLAYTQTDWNYEWGGDFVCKLTDNEYKSVPYKPNRCILFNGDLSHRGSAPNAFADDFRSSVAWTFTSVNTNIGTDATSYL